jgi:putative restriction endonuclease
MDRHFAQRNRWKILMTSDKERFEPCFTGGLTINRRFGTNSAETIFGHQKRKRGGALNPFYETMREVAPGDVVFSYAGGVIQGIGIAQTHCYTSPRPDEFGHIGEVWDELGWRVDVNFNRITPTLRPADHMQTLAPVLPERYSPLNEAGHGYQHIYLASIPKKMALMLGQLISPAVLRVVQATQAAEEANIVDTELLGVTEWEQAEAKRIAQTKTLSSTTRDALIKARWPGVV